MSLKQNNIRQGDGVSWEDAYDIDAGALTNATRDNFFVERKVLPGGNGEIAVAYYLGTGALTLTEFANFPLGSEIHASQLTTAAIYFKKAAAGTSTWKSQALNT